MFSSFTAQIFRTTCLPEKKRSYLLISFGILRKKHLLFSPRDTDGGSSIQLSQLELPVISEMTCSFCPAGKAAKLMSHVGFLYSGNDFKDSTNLTF